MKGSQRTCRNKNGTLKVRYKKKKLALEIANRHAKRKGEPIQAYHCMKCHGWHLGHPKGWHREQKRLKDRRSKSNIRTRKRAATRRRQMARRKALAAFIAGMRFLLDKQRFFGQRFLVFGLKHQDAG